MKNLYFVVIAICIFDSVNAQIIDIPDAIFKSKLIDYGIDINFDGNIQQSEALILKDITIDNLNISSLKGVEYFKNLNYLKCSNSNITNLDVSGLTNLEILDTSFSHYLSSINVNDCSNLRVINCFENNLSSLDLSNLTRLEEVACSYNNISNLNLANCSSLIKLGFPYNKIESIDLTSYKNLKDLSCANNRLTSLNLSNLFNLERIYCSDNLIINLNVSGCQNLQHIECFRNNISELSVNNLTKLKSLYCSDNKLMTLDLNSCLLFDDLLCDNNNLNSLYLKNGKNEGEEPYTNLIFSENPNLKYICCDESQSQIIKIKSNQYKYFDCNINSYCSFNPGGTFFTIKGSQKLDSDNNGCDSNDSYYSDLNFSITDGIQTGNIISNSTGLYSISVNAGSHIITPILENSNYFTAVPKFITVVFPNNSNPFIQNFCIMPNGLHNDLEVTILPIIPARPGFDATYKIIYKNKGTSVRSGSVSLNFNDTVLNYVSAIPEINNQVTDKLTWDYIDLKPLENREITVTLKVNSPMETPMVNIDDRLSFNALITPITGDEKPVDNSFALRQIVVGSFDPNDKTCLEGDIVTPSLIGEYVHYLIRFENTGTYPAENIVVKDMIDLSKFDISTLVPTKASHDFVTKISDGNKVEFIFEKINLPFDDANNDGYVAFKIKTLPTLTVGDSFENEAHIYFDYNFPILTNNAKSTFKTLGTQDFDFSDYFSVYPNPANNILNIEVKNLIEVSSIAVYDILGQLVIAVPDAQKVSNIDVSKLITGNYFLKMYTDKGTSTVKFIKNNSFKN